jgi:hypothetical protein
MKVKSIKSIYLTEKELKQAIADWLHAHGYARLADHLEDNLCEFEWSHQDDGVHLAVDMDGQFEENEE